MESTFLFIIEAIGTFAFAISGIRLAAYKNFDLFGAYTKTAGNEGFQGGIGLNF